MATPTTRAQIAVHYVELFASLLALGSAAVLTYYAGPFARLLSYCGLGVFTGASGLLVSVLLLIKAPKLLNAMRGLLELLISVAWAAFFIATGSLMAKMLSMGVCNYTRLAFLTAPSHRKLLQSSSDFNLAGLMAAVTGAATSLANALGAALLIPSPQTCAASAVLTATGFLGFCAFLAGAVLAVTCDVKKGFGLWAPASARAKAAKKTESAAASA